MKLQLVPARSGLAWVREGLRTFWRQPLAFVGLFFMFMAVVSVATMLPWIGLPLALVLLPALTLGMMAATREAVAGRFPMPWVLFTAFREGKARTIAMLQLGALYAAGFFGVMGFSALFDGGKFAQVYLLGGSLTPELMNAPGFQAATWAATAAYLPLSMMFWHAPALVHWHGVAPVKSLFFSFVACARNFKAFFLYTLGWLAVFIGAGVLAMLISALFGNPGIATVALVPAALMMAAMFFTSMWFTVRDCFLDEAAGSV
ncbi:hypothetical protein EDC62_0321 [Tibeticola sediminis]|jgi:hypothetical protein|uniref:Transmembrane protein n=1 Tax=Tibeticola sediminis TaxID=1917811 RepID=A0A3N4V691_9BURK|nr:MULTISPECIES: BPSS1780 family membrane protein [Tibeticola]MCI4440559.1 hypothetical protein [Tibeticola sp.]RPE72627.1 hypothetical protein EDC62_0321 [Tibeticola sediminis]